MKEHKTDMNITEKLNSTSTAEYKTDVKITEKLSSTFTTEHKTDMKNTRNWTALLWQSIKQTLNVLEMLNFMRMFVSCLGKVEWFYDCNKRFIDKLYTCLPLLVWS